MNASVLIDTSVWSLALRRNAGGADAAVAELRELIREMRAEIIGPIRQEVLSGIRSLSTFETLRDHLKAFPDIEILTDDYERAAAFFNACRAKGVQGSNTDFLICAVSERNGIPILTTDADFDLYAQHLPITLHQPRRSVEQR